jgi:hypothetical protein
MVDEDANFKEQCGGFSMPKFYYPLSGNGLICGTDEEAELADVSSSLEEIRKQIEFHPIEVMNAWRTQGFTRPYQAIL